MRKIKEAVLKMNFTKVTILNQVLIIKFSLYQQLISIIFIFIIKLKTMYSDYKGSGSYYNSYQSQEDLKRIPNTRLEASSPYEKPNISKALRWNIEESKENMASFKDHPFTSSSSQFAKPQLNGFLSNEYNTKKAWDKSITDYSKSKLAKSYKNIKFPNQIDYESEYSKTFQKSSNDYKSFERTDNLRSLAMSMDYKTSIKDLIPNLKAEDFKAKNSYYDDTYKKLKASKSERRINIDIEEPKETKAELRPQTPKKELTLKSYSKIADVVTEPKFVPSFTSTKSTKNLLEEVGRIKTEKTASYNETFDRQYDVSKLKKYQTVSGTRPFTGVSPQKQSDIRIKLSIDDFEVGACKGEGAFGQVFLAIHKATRMLVAIKKVPKEKVKYMLDQFINEIKIQLFLDHPNIVKLYGFFDDPSNFYIIMEYMEGGNLFSHIKKNKKITQNQTAERLKQVCLGLKEMHDHSILHRDIKPQNIVLTNDVCKLCDFGWSAICKDRRTTYCGTLDYVSPQIIGGQGYDDSVDIWCIGVLAYEMICGKTPFYNISRKETMNKIINVNYEYPPEITSKSKSFIDRILKKNPNDRIDIDQVLKDRFLSQ